MDDTDMKVKDDTEDKIRDRRDRDDKDIKRDKDRRDKSRSRERRDSGDPLLFLFRIHLTDKRHALHRPQEG